MTGFKYLKRMYKIAVHIFGKSEEVLILGREGEREGVWYYIYRTSLLYAKV